MFSTIYIAHEHIPVNQERNPDCTTRNQNFAEKNFQYSEKKLPSSFFKVLFPRKGYEWRKEPIQLVY